MGLPEPKLIETRCGGVPCYTDDVLFEGIGVRIAFTERAGGVSMSPFAELNLSANVGDARSSVEENRQRVLEGMGGKDCRLLVPNQVHGADIVCVQDGREGDIRAVRERISQGADGLIVQADNVAAMLGFADCIPVIMVAEDGAFAVVHAGWRGVMQRIAPKALKMLAERHPRGSSPQRTSYVTAARDTNIYIGPHIHRECFETSADIYARFTDEFGTDIAFGPAHIDLNAALRESLIEAGADPARIADVDLCTMCNSDKFFSYRASRGTCGRHGAIAFRKK